MHENIEEILNQAHEAIKKAKVTEELNQVRIAFLGKNGLVTGLLKSLGGLLAEERPTAGAKINSARNQISEWIDGALSSAAVQERKSKLSLEKVDVTLPGVRREYGAAHPLTKAYREVRSIFASMGFTVREGPEIEYDKYNFEMLNIPKDHPARDMQDTFYVTEDIVLRTHTSPVQIRTMLSEAPPIRMICPGRVYRSDDVDATHSPVFNQIEGLVVGKGISFADLKGTLNTFLRKLYGDQTKTKFRPGFFPFTEPSAEVDATCTLCGGKGCPACKGAGMIEVLGCGMVNPKVLKNCGIDPDVYSGYAFGLGLDRLANIKYKITDIRLLYENDVRFLEQFK